MPFASLIILSLVAVIGLGFNLRRVKSLTQELNQQKKDFQEQISEHEKLIADKDLVKTKLMTQVSNELKAPLEGIIGMTNLMLEDSIESTLRMQCLAIQSSAYTLLRLMNSISDISKIEEKQLSIKNLVFSSRPWFERLLKHLDSHAARKHYELIGIFAEDIPPTLIGDPDRIKQVVLTLISSSLNRVQKSGGMVVNFQAIEKTDRDIVLEISVSDSGTGISEELQEISRQSNEEIYRRTFQKNQSNNLDLAIAKVLVESMDGTIKIKSKDGIGSVVTFSVRLGYHHEDFPNLKTLSNKIHKYLPGTRVLLMDENVANSRHLESLLRSWGMCPFTVHSYMDAINCAKIAKANDEEYDLILANLNPDGNAESVAENLQDQLESTSSFLYLASRDQAVNIDKKKSKFKSESQCVFKPATYSSLLEALVTLKEHPNNKSVTIIEGESEHLLPSPTRTLKVLLAEDHAVSRKLMFHILAKRGHKISLVSNGIEALSLLNKNPSYYDLILMDINMPEMGGEQATHLIRESNKEYSQIPIVALTAHAMKGDRERFLNLGMDDYLSKPIDRTELFAVLDRIVSGI